MTQHRRTLRLAVVVLAAVAVVPTLAGCWQGQAASTTWQASQNSGNGVEATVGSLSVQNATVVKGDDGRASLIFSVFNLGQEPDALIGATIGGIAATLPETPGTTAVAPGGTQAFGYGIEGQPPANLLIVDGLEAAPSGYVPVTLTFERAGQLSMSVLTVPPVGYYEGLLPPAA